MTMVDPIIRGLFVAASDGWPPTVRGRVAPFFFCFCASAAVPAHSEIMTTAIIDLIMPTFFWFAAMKPRPLRYELTWPRHTRLPQPTHPLASYCERFQEHHWQPAQLQWSLALPRSKAIQYSASECFHEMSCPRLENQARRRSSTSRRVQLGLAC